MPRTKKPKKPYKDFPLFLHASGQWAKKIRGRTHYFGSDPIAARDKYAEQRDDLQAGKPPRASSDDMTLRDLVNKFLTSKKSLVDTGELSPRTWGDYYACCERLIDTLGKGRAVANLAGEDFERHRSALAKKRGPVALGNEIQRVRTLFKYAWDEGLIEKPIRFGSLFKKPTRKVIRKARHAAGPRMIEAADVRRLLDAAGTPMKAMILLGINCAFGQTDVANLPRSAIDLETGWVNFPRPKTAIPRRCPLWPETVAAVKEAIAVRPEAKDHADAALVFITKYGKRWVRVRERDGKAAVAIDSIRLEFEKLLVALSLKRPGMGFYTLRHVFRTIADSSKDQAVIDCIMGHTRDDMASLYRERIDDARFAPVVQIVHEWLWPK